MLRNSSLVWGFTLLELLIVIAILATLATIVVLVINPVEYLKQSRDAKRIAEMVALNKALNLAEFENVALGGASTTVFTSLLDTASSTCGTLGLPTLPAGYQYHCVTVTTDLRKTDGTGWIPVNMGSITGGSPLATLPVDPINDATKFYTYIPGGSFALSATLESEKFMKESGNKDSGTNPAKIEKGSNLKLLTNAEGLAGYWPFDEDSGTVAMDASGNGNTGVVGGATIASGKIGNGRVFDGVGDTISIANEILTVSKIRESGVTYSIWVKPNNVNIAQVVFGQRPTNGYSDQASGGINIKADGSARMVAYDNGVAYKYADSNAGSLNAGRWYLLVGTYDPSTKKMRIYIDGQLAGESGTVATFAAAAVNGFNGISKRSVNDSNNEFSGSVDDARVYNRALSPGEIQSLYNATK